MRLLNAINARWNRLIYWMHDATTRTGIGWLVTASIWAYDRLTWRLPDRWQLVCGTPLVEYTLRHELALARHQARWFAEYANDLQLAMLLSEFTEPEEAGVLEV
jgi:hypothetical protein